MIQFLQQEIEELKPYRHKALHEVTVRDDLSVHHGQLKSIVDASKEVMILDELQMDEQKDELLLEKFEKMRELQEKTQLLQMALLEKSRIMRECEINQLKLKNVRGLHAEIQAKCKTHSIEKDKIMREIKENQVLCERARIENEDLRRKCQEEIKTVTDETVNGETMRAEDMIRKNIEENLSIVGKLISLTEPYQANCQALTKSSTQTDALRVIQLTKELQQQNAENFMVRTQLKCEEIKYFELSAKYELLTKDHQVRSTLAATLTKEEEELCIEIERERAKRQELQSKLSQYKRLRKELEQMYGKLSAHYDSCKYSDLHGVREMNKNSHRMERSITQQRHFLIERYSIVDNYRKYLRNN